MPSNDMTGLNAICGGECVIGVEQNPYKCGDDESGAGEDGIGHTGNMGKRHRFIFIFIAS